MEPSKQESSNNYECPPQKDRRVHTMHSFLLKSLLSIPLLSLIGVSINSFCFDPGQKPRCYMRKNFQSETINGVFEAPKSKFTSSAWQGNKNYEHACFRLLLDYLGLKSEYIVYRIRQKKAIWRGQMVTEHQSSWIGSRENLQEKHIPSSKCLHNYGKSPCFLLIPLAIFNSKLVITCHYQRVQLFQQNMLGGSSFN